MKVIEKPWKYGTYLAYEEVEPEFQATQRGVRVLPAPFFYEKKLHFTLHRRYEPGEKKSFPNGGFEVSGEFGGIRAYDLDQVIIHPDVLKQQKMLAKMRVRAEKNAEKLERKRKREEKKNKPKSGKRGRPSLTPEEKTRRATLKQTAGERSGGKRGRPPGPPREKAAPASQPSGKRGRPALSAEAKAEREQARLMVRARSGGRRGRPKRS